MSGFNLDLLGAMLNDVAPFDVRLQAYESLASTNQTLWKLMQQGAPVGTAVIALEQTAGKGQWGRQWSSNKGGLYLSLALEPNMRSDRASWLTICTAWGIASQLRRYEIPVRLKWANDLILNRRKLGGILTETRIQRHIITQAVVGVGINWINPVPEEGINLQEFIATIDSLEKLAAAAIAGIAIGYSYCNPQKFPEIIPLYRQLLTADTYADTMDLSEIFFQQLQLD